MPNKSPFAVHKALGIGGEPKTVKRLRSGDLLIETNSAIQTKSFLLAKTFLNSPLIVTPHKSLNSCRGVISEPDLLTTSESEILEGFSDQGVIRVRRITIKKNTTVFPTKHLILTFNSPNLPTSIKALYLHCVCAKFARTFRTLCAASSARDCSLEQKCVNCSQPHSADSKLCPKWKIEKEIQTIKTNRNVSYIEARKFITPQPSQTYAQVAKSITVNSSSQTDETITKLVCPPLKLLQPLITISKPIMSPSIPEVVKSSTSTQAELIPSTSSVTVASPSKSPPPTSVIDTAPTTSNSLSISAASSSSTAGSVLETTTTTSTVSPENLPVSVHNDSNSDHSIAAEAQQFVKRKSRNRRKRPKIQKPDIEIKRVPHKSRNATPTQITTDDEDMITYDVEEEELEQDPFILPKGYLRALTPSRYRNYRE
ncbi:putative RNA-directed DNA polymerase from transposon BS [Trichonephila clavipes]|nr:putative RNA-directed DNA polymerase from transposon BS [Trichonephila clavipes]